MGVRKLCPLGKDELADEILDRISERLGQGRKERESITLSFPVVGWICCSRAGAQMDRRSLGFNSSS